MTPRQVASSHRRTMLWSTLCLSLPLPASLLAELQARNHGQGLGPRFASLHQAQRVSSPSYGLAPLDKVWVHTLPFSTRLSVSPHRVAGSHRATRILSTYCLSTRLSVSNRRVAVSHRRTRLESTLCLSPPSLAHLLDKSWACNLGQCLGLGFASLYRLSVSLHRVAGSHP